MRLIAGMLFVGLSAAAVLGLAQPDAAPKAPAANPPGNVRPTVEQVSQMLEAQSKRAPEHDVLGALEGDWTIESRMWLDPAQEPLTARGEAGAGWILGRRFVELKAKTGDDAGKELKSESLSIFGYDTRVKKYTLVAFDTFGTYSVSASGDYDEKSRTITLNGTVEEHGRAMTFRWGLRLESKDRFVQEILFEMEPGKWTKIAEVVAKRK